MANALTRSTPFDAKYELGLELGRGAHSIVFQARERASGAQCGDAGAAAKGMSAEGVILVIVCIMLAGVLGGVGYMFVRLRKLQVDPGAYGQLEGKYNELGDIA